MIYVTYWDHSWVEPCFVLREHTIKHGMRFRSGQNNTIKKKKEQSLKSMKGTDCVWAASGWTPAANEAINRRLATRSEQENKQEEGSPWRGRAAPCGTPSGTVTEPPGTSYCPLHTSSSLQDTRCISPSSCEKYDGRKARILNVKEKNKK